MSRHTGSGTTFEGADYLGTNRVETNSAQSVTGTRTYDAFGNLESTTGSPVGPFGFNGQNGYQGDPDSGLQLLGHRYYDPTTGRFLTRDPAGDGRNWYAYCAGDPTGLLDPAGQRSFMEWLETGFGIQGFYSAIVDWTHDIGSNSYTGRRHKEIARNWQLSSEGDGDTSASDQKIIDNAWNGRGCNAVKVAGQCWAVAAQMVYNTPFVGASGSTMIGEGNGTLYEGAEKLAQELGLVSDRAQDHMWNGGG